MLTSSSAAAMSSSLVANGSPACGLRMPGTVHTCRNPTCSSTVRRVRTVVIDGPGSVTVETRPDPVLPGPDGALVRVDVAAICGSDLHFYDGDIAIYPLAPGHEVVGTVVEVGP